MASEVIDYEAVLADLEAKKTSIEAAIAGIRQMLNLGAQLGVGSAGTKGVESNAVESDTFFGMSIGEGAKKYLRMIKRKQTAAKIAEALEAGGFQHTSKSFPNTVRTTLLRMAVDGDVVQVGKEWGLPEWYPGYRKGQRSKDPDASESPSTD
jgi:hypothetical protein